MIHILHCDDLLLSVVLLLIGQLLLESVVSAYAEVAVRVNRSLGTEAAICGVLRAGCREPRIIRGVGHRPNRLVLRVVDLMMAALENIRRAQVLCMAVGRLATDDRVLSIVRGRRQLDHGTAPFQVVLVGVARGKLLSTRLARLIQILGR